MAEQKNDKKLVEQITSMKENFAQWYTDVCIKADLIGYASVKGCMIYRPYGYAIWENIQKIFDEKFKETGHENVYMPLFSIRKRITLKDLRRRLHGLRTEEIIRLLRECACVRRQRRFSAIIIKILFTHGEIFLSFIISGVLLFAGKRLPVLFCAAASFSGRRDILFMRRLKRLRRRRSGC